MKTRVFQRYAASGFFGPFFGSLAVFTAMLLLGHLLGHLYVFTKGEVSAVVFFKYIIYQMPYFMVKIMPVATLIGVLLALGKMVASGEWKAGMAGGWRPFDMVRPLLLCSIFAGLFQFSVQETLAPSLYLESVHIFRRDIRNRSDWARLLVKNVSFTAGEGKFVSCQYFDGSAKIMSRVILSEYSDGKLISTLQADHASWDDAIGAWVFWDATETVFPSGNGAYFSFPRVKRHISKNAVSTVRPDDLILENLEPDGVNIKGIMERIRKLRLVGAPSVAEHTLLWCKAAAPFANIVMALIGAAMALIFTGNRRFYSYGAAIAIGFLFWAALVFSQEIGTAEMLPPALAGISPLVIFGFFSLWIMRRARI